MRPGISIAADCGNSPRKSFLKDLHIAIAAGDHDRLAELIPDDELVWNLVGYETVNDRSAFISGLKKAGLWKVKSLSLDRIITHGAEASTSGTSQPVKGKPVAFAFFHNFKGAGGFKLVEVTSFLVSL